MKETSVPGVFACGDLARAAGNVALAVGDGAVAGTAAHQSLVAVEPGKGFGLTRWDWHLPT